MFLCCVSIVDSRNLKQKGNETVVARFTPQSIPSHAIKPGKYFWKKQGFFLISPLKSFSDKNTCAYTSSLIKEASYVCATLTLYNND